MLIFSLYLELRREGLMTSAELNMLKKTYFGVFLVIFDFKQKIFFPLSKVS